MRTTTAEIRDLYELHDSDLFDDFPSLVNGIREHVDRIYTVCKIVKLEHPASVLDIGCNRGLFGSLIRLNHGSVKNVSGVDISGCSCRHALKMGYDHAYQLNASEPFNLSQKFNFVLCMEILEHVPDPIQVVRNAFTHLYPGGKALFTCPVEEGEIDGEFHVRKVLREDLLHWIEEAGFLKHPQNFFLESTFCEKPHWKGWNFVLAVKPA